MALDNYGTVSELPSTYAVKEMVGYLKGSQKDYSLVGTDFPNTPFVLFSYVDGDFRTPQMQCTWSVPGCYPYHHKSNALQ